MLQNLIQNDILFIEIYHFLIDLSERKGDTKMRDLSREEFLQLPTEVQEEVKHILEAYDECNIVFENGKYNCNPDAWITASYPEDYKYIGYVKAETIFTEDERQNNFEKVFGYKHFGRLLGYDSIR